MLKREDEPQTLDHDKAETASIASPATTPDACSDLLEMPSRQLPSDVEGNPKTQAQKNYTDPTTTFSKAFEAGIEGCNAQNVVDGDQISIVAIGDSNQPSDAEHLLPMVERILANTGRLPNALIADDYYLSLIHI